MYLRYCRHIVILLIFNTLSNSLFSQYLEKTITLSSKSNTVGKVLDELEQKGNFRFSYQSTHVDASKAANIPLTGTVRDHLRTLFNNEFQFRENSTHIILVKGEAKLYTIDGDIRDEQTNQPLNDVTVFETTSLLNTTSASGGHFSLTLKNSEKISSPLLRVSKAGYYDQDYKLEAGYDRTIDVKLIPSVIVTLDSIDVIAGNRFERSRIGKALIGSQQLVNSINVKDFLSEQPLHFSLIPGISTHGKISTAARNHFSLNILGGYSGALNGFEMGSAFNIIKGDARYVQVAGVFNAVDHNFRGLQVAGIYNGVRTLRGVQVATINNARIKAKGVQTGVINKARKMTGLQIGVVNITDTLDGISFGVFSYNRSGINRVSLTMTENAIVQLGWQSGNKGLYTIIQAGVKPNDSSRILTAGYGFGSGILLHKRLVLNTELGYNVYYIGGFDDMPWAARLQSSLQIKLLKKLSITGGVSYSVTGDAPTIKYKSYVSDIAIKPRQIADGIRGWLGWQLGFLFL